MRRVFEIINSGDLRSAGDLIADDVVDHEVPPSLPRGLTGWKQYVGMMRTSFPDLELVAEDTIAEGDKVVLYYPSANHDEEVFSDPLRFDIKRDPNEHLTFGGGGAHFCLGANLARLEIRLMFDEVRRRLPDIELAAPPRRLRSNFINGIKEMRVKFTPTARVAG